MKDALMNGDIHYQTANAIYEKGISFRGLSKAERIALFKPAITDDERYTGKKTNHATSYLMGAIMFVRSYNQESPNPIVVSQAKRFQDLWHAEYYNVKPWQNSILNELHQTRTLANLYGRKRTFLGIVDHEMHKIGCAYKPQSTVADHFNGYIQLNGSNVKGGLLEFKKQVIDKAKGEVKLVNQSHDSGMLVVPKTIAMEVGLQFKSILYRPLIINGEECNIPVDLEIGERWGELEKVK